MSYIVPIEIPKFCDDCPFGRCVFSRPKWTEENHNEVCANMTEKKQNPIRMDMYAILSLNRTESTQM